MTELCLKCGWDVKGTLHYKQCVEQEPTPANEGPFVPAYTKHWSRWWLREGEYFDPDVVDVSWFDKRKELAEQAFKHGFAQGVASVQGELAKEREKLKEARGWLKWALDYIADGSPWGDDDEFEVPEHGCDYSLAPDKGYCEFHDQYCNARESLNTL